MTVALCMQQYSTESLCSIIHSPLCCFRENRYLHKCKTHSTEGWDAPCEKQWEQEVFLAILSRILAQSCVTLPTYSGKGLRMIVLVSLIVLLRRLLVPTVIRMVHPYNTVNSFLQL